MSRRMDYLPLVGSTLEQLILSNITMLFGAMMFKVEEAFPADWISKHH
jgi:hypothetical protein